MFTSYLRWDVRSTLCCLFVLMGTCSISLGAETFFLASRQVDADPADIDEINLNDENPRDPPEPADIEDDSDTVNLDSNERDQDRSDEDDERDSARRDEDEDSDRRENYNFCPANDELFGDMKSISEVSASISIKSERFPEDCSSGLFQGKLPAMGRSDQMVAFHWQPTNFFHQPLYFDDTPLERYGQSICPKWQPVLSGVRFFGTFPLIPYKMGLDRTHDCVSTLGYYRPGSCAPCMRERLVPAWERDATLLEAGVALALIFALP